MAEGSISLGNEIKHIMSASSVFKSRTGRLEYSAEDVFSFVTDIRNFERFIPRNSVHDIKTEQGSCSFRVNMLGEVNIRIKEKIMTDKVVFSGNAPQINEFLITINIHNTGNNKSEVNVILSSEMNPLLKMIAAEPVNQMLVKLIDEMERFDGWKDIYQST